jgi:hypothetical protein
MRIVDATTTPMIPVIPKGQMMVFCGELRLGNTGKIAEFQANDRVSLQLEAARIAKAENVCDGCLVVSVWTREGKIRWSLENVYPIRSVRQEKRRIIWERVGTWRVHRLRNSSGFQRSIHTCGRALREWRKLERREGSYVSPTWRRNALKLKRKVDSEQKLLDREQSRNAIDQIIRSSWKIRTKPPPLENNPKIQTTCAPNT